MLRSIFKRLKEPSTMAGLSMLAVLFGVRPEEVDAVGAIVGAVLAGAAVLLPEATPVQAK